MKLLFYLYRYPGWGGIETVTDLIIRELQTRGYEIDLVSHIQQLGAQSIPEGITLFQLPDRTPYSENNSNYFHEILTTKGYDKVIYQDCYKENEQILVENCRRLDIPYIVFEHNTPLLLDNIRLAKPWCTLKGFLKRIFYPYFHRKYLSIERQRKTYLYDNCEYYVMLSQNYIPEIMERLRIKNITNKFRFINNPIKATNHQLGIKQKEILYVGRLVVEKRVDKILKIWDRLSSLVPDYKLTIVGDGPEAENLKRLSAKLKLKNITFMGYQKSSSYFSRASVMLMTSRYEGWAMTLVEAQSLGCIPVAEKTFSSLPDIIDSEYNGIIMQPNAPIDIWVSTLLNLLSDTERMKKMAENAIIKSQRFRVEKITDAWEALLNSK